MGIDPKTLAAIEPDISLLAQLYEASKGYGPIRPGGVTLYEHVQRGLQVYLKIAAWERRPDEARGL